MSRYYFNNGFRYFSLKGQLSDEEGNEVYHFEPSSERTRVTLFKDEEETGHVETEFKILYRDYAIYQNEEKKELYSHFLTLFHGRISLTKTHLLLKGNFMLMEYTINRGDEVLCTIHNDDKGCCVEIKEGEDEVYLLLVVLMVNLYNRFNNNLGTLNYD